MKIHTLLSADWPELYRLRKADVIESDPAWPQTPALDVALAADTAQLMAQPGAVALVAVEEQVAIGYLLVVVERIPWRTEAWLSVTGFWVDPKYRGGAAASMLLRRFKRFVQGLKPVPKVRATINAKNATMHYGQNLKFGTLFQTTQEFHL